MTAHPSNRAFSMIEVLLATAVTGILSLAIGGVLVVASRAIPASPGQHECAAHGARLLGLVESELAVARTLTYIDSANVEFTVADRTGDGLDDTIRYSWDGKSPGTLTRTFNGVAASLTDDLRAFSLALNARTQSVADPANPVTGAERLLSSCDATGGSTVTLTATTWPAQYILPILPSDTISYSITKVALQVKQTALPTGSFALEVRGASMGAAGPGLGTPTVSVLASTTVLESTLPLAWGWKTVTVSGATGIAANTGICLNLKYLSGVQAGYLLSLTSGVPNARENSAVSANSGSTWTITSDASIGYQLYGTITRPGTKLVARASSVALRMQIGAAAAGAVERTIRIVDEPVAPVSVIQGGAAVTDALPVSLPVAVPAAIPVGLP